MGTGGDYHNRNAPQGQQNHPPTNLAIRKKTRFFFFATSPFCLMLGWFSILCVGVGGVGGVGVLVLLMLCSPFFPFFCFS